jgi:uncharacterized membrane-anchored protein
VSTTRREEVTLVVGPARVDRRTKDLIRRLQAGDIAVIDHEDLDRIAAEGLVEARVAAVINAAPSMSGRYPNVGPLLLAAASIPLVDGVGQTLLDQISEGQLVRVDGADIWIGPALVASGNRQSLHSLEATYEASKSSLGEEIERFAENTLEFMRREGNVVLNPKTLAGLRTRMAGRHVLIVVRGHDYKSDLDALSYYVQDARPVLVGVDGGADALLDAGLKPDLIIGDFDSVSEAALRCGAELVVHAFSTGGAPGATRLDELGLEYLTFEAAGTSEDIAMLLAYEEGAELIVAVGTHVSMVEFLGKGRPGMASTFLTRLKVSDRLMDAKGVSKLYQGRIRKRDMIMFLFTAMLLIGIVVVVLTPPIFRQGVGLILRDFIRSLTH